MALRLWGHRVMQHLDWDDLRMFAVLARAGSVRRAAELLDVHASTVTRRLEHFERQLDVQLFNRTPRGLLITPAGQEVLDRVEGVAERIADIERAVTGSDQRMAGPLRLWVPESVAGVAMPAVAGYAARFPDVEVEFVPVARRPDVGRREADCGLFVTDRPPEHLVGRRVGRLALAVYGTRDWARRAASGESCRWIDLAAPPELRCDLRHRDFPNAAVGGRCHDVASQAAALRAGVGIGPLPCLVGDADAALVRVGAAPPLPGREIWVLMHPDLRSCARVREMGKALTEAFARCAAVALDGDAAQVAAA